MEKKYPDWDYLDDARLIYPEVRDFKVIVSRRDKTCLASPKGFCDASVHLATLLVHADEGSVVLNESGKCECLADAVENLWEKWLEKTREVAGERDPSS